ncbi:glutamine-dependent NAD(+) synthetase-like protein [Sarcoptes scabiei]|uniref:Glutamine-dependent NAD(+) synthetase n=1 Tax=Sarcoptes scabiei TaxID=52283 RepID=A0A132AEQ2_SARSC|nr:glutamine-dependent NAD(+) synthetase-like protein [Sarcoptes scabiei]
MSSLKFGIAICTLNQLCLDFKHNLNNIIKSIEESIEAGASIRIGPELEVTGYGCEDAFFEFDTVYHSWQVLAEILKRNYRDILICIGMPILKDSSLYNCVVIILNSKLVYIRPKNRLAMQGNYRESRYFTPWNDGTQGSMCWFEVPPFITEINLQTRVPFGDGTILKLNHRIEKEDFISSINGFKIGFEICEELWQSDTQNSRLFGTRGCHLVINPSSSYWELRKLDLALNHVKSATSKTGGSYAYVNNIGCDGGGRLCFYGRSFVMENGELLQMASKSSDDIFDLVNVSVAFIDPINTEQFRLQNGISIKSCTIGENVISFDSEKSPYDACESFANISNINVISVENVEKIFSRDKISTQPINYQNFLSLTSEEEIKRYCSLWLWDYLRRCIDGGIKGFIVPLSGGLDSSSVVCIVYCLCELLYRQVFVVRNLNVIKSLQSIISINDAVDLTPENFCNRLLRCCYLKTKYSGQESLDRAQSLANLVGADFQVIDFTEIYQMILDKTPFKINCDSEIVTVQQQNLQVKS